MLTDRRRLDMRVWSKQENVICSIITIINLPLSQDMINQNVSVGRNKEACRVKLHSLTNTYEHLQSLHQYITQSWHVTQIQLTT
jgi:hypothetical protein